MWSKTNLVCHTLSTSWKFLFSVHRQSSRGLLKWTYRIWTVGFGFGQDWYYTHLAKKAAHFLNRPLIRRMWKTVHLLKFPMKRPCPSHDLVSRQSRSPLHFSRTLPRPSLQNDFLIPQHFRHLAHRPTPRLRVHSPLSPCIISRYFSHSQSATHTFVVIFKSKCVQIKLRTWIFYIASQTTPGHKTSLNVYKSLPTLCTNYSSVHYSGQWASDYTHSNKDAQKTRTTLHRTLNSYIIIT